MASQPVVRHVEDLVTRPIGLVHAVYRSVSGVANKSIVLVSLSERMER